MSSTLTTRPQVQTNTADTDELGGGVPFRPAPGIMARDPKKAPPARRPDNTKPPVVSSANPPQRERSDSAPLPLPPDSGARRRASVPVGSQGRGIQGGNGLPRPQSWTYGSNAPTGPSGAAPAPNQLQVRRNEPDLRIERTSKPDEENKKKSLLKKLISLGLNPLVWGPLCVGLAFASSFFLGPVGIAIGFGVACLLMATVFQTDLKKLQAADLKDPKNLAGLGGGALLAGVGLAFGIVFPPAFALTLAGIALPAKVAAMNAKKESKSGKDLADAQNRSTDARRRNEDEDRRLLEEQAAGLMG